jgi:hypothetical protein
MIIANKLEELGFKNMIIANKLEELGFKNMIIANKLEELSRQLILQFVSEANKYCKLLATTNLDYQHCFYLGECELCIATLRVFGILVVTDFFRNTYYVIIPPRLSSPCSKNYSPSPIVPKLLEKLCKKKPTRRCFV